MKEGERKEVAAEEADGEAPRVATCVLSSSNRTLGGWWVAGGKVLRHWEKSRDTASLLQLDSQTSRY